MRKKDQLILENLYDLILEGLQDFSPSDLGLFNSMARLPMKKPYGFWMDRHGNYIPVFDHMAHDKIAMGILQKAEEDFDEEGEYDKLLKRGWVRIVTGMGNKTYYETYMGQPLTNIQKRNLKFFNDFYDLKGIEEG